LGVSRAKLNAAPNCEHKQDQKNLTVEENQRAALIIGIHCYGYVYPQGLGGLL
jgi:hypothetical protein